MSKTEELITTPQAAKLLHVSEDTLRRLGDQGKVTMTKTQGGHRRVYRRSVL
jgi:excisionase family DNA binding protein